MIPRLGQMLALSTAFAFLSIGCQSESGGDARDNSPLNADEAAQYRQVKLDVTGAT